MMYLFCRRGPLRLKSLVIPLSVCLLGCEAQLNLTGVDQELGKSVLRTDQYQALAAVGDALVLVGSSGVVLRSADAGQSWQRQQLPGSPDLIGIAACADDSLIALSFGRQLWSSADQGLSWTAHALPTGEDTLGLTCAPDGSWWVTGSFSTLLRSQDQGASWDEQSLGEDALVTQIHFFDEQQGVASAEFGLLFRTEDGGAQWDMIGTVGQELYPLALHFSTPERGWIGGLNGVIQHTQDGGATWEEQSSGVVAPIYRFFEAGGQLYAAGDHMTLLRYVDETWQAVETPNKPVYLSVGQGVGADQLLLAGGWGTLIRLPAPSDNPSVAAVGGAL